MRGARAGGVHDSRGRDVDLCFASERAKGWGGCLGKIGSYCPVDLRYVIGQIRYGRGRKGKRQCWKQRLVIVTAYGKAIR